MLQFLLLALAIIGVVLLIINTAAGRLQLGSPLARLRGQEGAITSFIPEIWAAQLLASLKKSLVYAQDGVVNRDYEGEISAAGDTVRITSIGRPTIVDYTTNTDLPAPEELTDAQRTLLIDQQKAFNFQVDDVDQAQARGDVMPTAMDEAAYALRDVADSFVAGLYTGVAAANDMGTTQVNDGDKAYNALVDLSVKLDEANVPTEGRWVVVPPWFHGLLRKNSNFINAEKSADGGRALRTGEIGEAASFRVLKSNNVPLITGDDYAVLAGYPGAISYAEQIVSTEAFRMEKRFADGVKGLHVYGAKLVRPTGVALCRASKT